MVNSPRSALSYSWPRAPARCSVSQHELLSANGRNFIGLRREQHTHTVHQRFQKLLQRCQAVMVQETQCAVVILITVFLSFPFFTSFFFVVVFCFNTMQVGNINKGYFFRWGYFYTSYTLVLRCFQQSSFQTHSRFLPRSGFSHLNVSQKAPPVLELALALPGFRAIFLREVSFCAGCSFQTHWWGWHMHWSLNKLALKLFSALSDSLLFSLALGVPLSGSIIALTS